MRPSVVAELQNEIHGSAYQRYGRRLHAVLLLEQGFSYPAVAGALGETPRTLARWVRRYRENGMAGLEEGGKGRPHRLTEAQREEIRAVVARPERAGLGDGKWTAAALAAWIEHRYRVKLCDRQCGRLLGKARQAGVSGGPIRNRQD